MSEALSKNRNEDLKSNDDWKNDDWGEDDDWDDDYTDEFSYCLDNLPFDTMRTFLDFAAKPHQDSSKKSPYHRFYKMQKAIESLEDRGSRLKFAEAFLAADFGEDFGDALLDIADSTRLESEQKTKILEQVDKCRTAIKDITELYQDFDNAEFSKQYARAANERLSDVITVFSTIAKDGVASADLGWAGKTNLDYEKAMKALEYEANSLSIINGTLTDVKTGSKGAYAEKILEPTEGKERTLYNFYSPEHGYVLIYTRAEGSGSFDPMMEYGKRRSKYRMDNANSGVEASISMIANPVNPFDLPNPFRPNPEVVKNRNFYDNSTMDKVSAIRIDREGRAPDKSAFDEERDPINERGTVSVDLAAIGDRDDTPSGQIARLVSTGDTIRAVKSGGDTSLNHNTHWFDQEKYGTSKGFSEIVKYLDSVLDTWCREHKPGLNEGFTAEMRKAKRVRGAKVRRVA